MVPAVERGLREVDFWSMETAGDRPSMKSTSGLSIWPRNCLAYADSDSTYRRWPSAKMVSNARLDLPEPDKPVNTIMASRGRSSETSLRLCSRAPRTKSRSATAPLLSRVPGKNAVGREAVDRVAIVAGGSDILGRRARALPRCHYKHQIACRYARPTHSTIANETAIRGRLPARPARPPAGPGGPGGRRPRPQNSASELGRRPGAVAQRLLVQVAGGGQVLG